MLKSKVPTRLYELVFEINVVKENKPYSITTLEGVINDFKREKAELIMQYERRTLSSSVASPTIKSRYANIFIGITCENNQFLKK